MEEPPMTTQTIPNTSKITSLIQKCAFNPDNDVTIGVKTVEGVDKDYAFDPTRLKECEHEIIEQLEGLPDNFKKGWSFLEACMNREGVQWGEQANVEELMVLGIALDKVKYCLPRDVWYMLPGGMPYFEVSL